MPSRSAAGRVAVRVDSSQLHGSGHVNRCLTLARELVRAGMEVQFISRALPGNLIARIEAAGHQVHTLPAATHIGAEPAWLNVSIERDAEETQCILQALQPQWLIVDHYGLDGAWERQQRGVVGRLMVIDDLADRPHDCDLLLDQNFFGERTTHRYAGLVPSDASLLLGPRYALLHRDYAALHRLASSRVRTRQRVLVFFGATDADNETAKALQALMTPELASLAVDVVLGPNHPDPAGVAELGARRGNTMIHRNLPSLAGLLFQADVAVGAGGTTTWERLCLAVPSVVVTVAANQEESTRSLSATGQVRWAGQSPQVSVAQYATAMRELLEARQSAPSPVDGLGAQRVCAAMGLAPLGELYLEPATLADARLLMDFRAQDMSWDEHCQDLERCLTDPGTQLFIGKVGDLPVGQVCLQRTGGLVRLSVAVEPCLPACEVGMDLVQAAIARLHPGAPLRLLVLREDTRSQEVLRRLGWAASEVGGERVYELATPAPACSPRSGQGESTW